MGAGLLATRLTRRLALCFLCLLTSARAHAEAPVVVVVEAVDGGDAIGERVRLELSAQLGTEVMWAHSGAALREQPVLLIAAGKRRRGELSVWYWDTTGASDMLTVPTADGADAIAHTITTLSLALIGRNVPKPSLCLDALAPDFECSTAAELRWGVRTLSYLGSKPVPRTARLQLTDF